MMLIPVWSHVLSGRCCLLGDVLHTGGGGGRCAAYGEGYCLLGGVLLTIGVCFLPCEHNDTQV